MSEVEIEFKNLLTKNEYEKLLSIYDLENIDSIINANYYYDTPKEYMKKNNSALRIRHTKKYSEITLKIKKDKYNKEINIQIENSFLSDSISYYELPEKIKKELINFSEDNIFFQIEKIETERKELQLKEGLLVLDKTIFSNDVVDYELEFEVLEYKSGKEFFENILSENKIEKKLALPKIARAKEYKKNNSR